MEDNKMEKIMIGSIKPPVGYTIIDGDSWKKYKQIFNLYLVATGLEKEEDERKIAVFLSCAGDEMLDVYNGLGVIKSWKALEENLNNHFGTKNNTVANSYNFFNLRQEEVENVDRFITRLRNAANNCDFKEAKRLIRDLSIVNSWRLYKNDCVANKFPRKDTMPLLDFRMDVANSLSSLPDRRPREDCDEDITARVPRRDYKIYRPSLAPTESKRYDGYEHYPISDDIKAPRSCRLEDCNSRSKIKCEKCDVYLCLSRNKNCFKTYHKK
ncbi:uncharacterized protein LOC132903054 [Amyelois transitella]|uniref:uncharacterized protein LOC132903054 n=1 Tax=Amyelois transitella TaxID=680683 RepID=UPI00298F5B52|nr:uncharacterized protein LOC132903054 [Amyelois transitella]